MLRTNRITKYWQDNEDFSARPQIDFDANPIFIEATEQLAALLKAFPNYVNLVEVGSGNGSYLNYLAQKFTFKKVIGSDLKGPRLLKARQDYPYLKFVAGNALQVIKKYNKPDTIFLAMNVLDNLVPADVEKLFSRFKLAQTAFIFCSGGLSVDIMDKFRKRGRPFNPEHTTDLHVHAYSHNYVDLIRQSNLRCHSAKITYNGDAEGRGVFIMTCFTGAKTSS